MKKEYQVILIDKDGIEHIEDSVYAYTYFEALDQADEILDPLVLEENGWERDVISACEHESIGVDFLY